jgi:hypothetical protein
MLLSAKGTPAIPGHMLCCGLAAQRQRLLVERRRGVRLQVDLLRQHCSCGMLLAGVAAPESNEEHCWHTLCADSVLLTEELTDAR